MAWIWTNFYLSIFLHHILNFCLCPCITMVGRGNSTAWHTQLLTVLFIRLVRLTWNVNNDMTVIKDLWCWILRNLWQVYGLRGEVRMTLHKLALVVLTEDGSLRGEIWWSNKIVSNMTHMCAFVGLFYIQNSDISALKWTGWSSWISEWIVLPPASAGIWSIPGDLCLFSFSVATPMEVGAMNWTANVDQISQWAVRVAQW